MQLLGQFSVRARVALLVLIPTLALIGFASLAVVERNRTVAELGQLEEMLDAGRTVTGLVHALQEERNQAALHLARGEASGEALEQAIRRSDQELARWRERLAGITADAAFQERLTAAEQAVAELPGVREALRGRSIKFGPALQPYNRANSALLGLLSGLTRLSQDAGITRATTAQLAFLQAEEQRGLQQAHAGHFYTGGHLDIPQRVVLTDAKVAEATYLDLFQGLARPRLAEAVAAVRDSELFKDMLALQDEILSNPYMEDAARAERVDWDQALAAQNARLAELQELITSDLVALAESRRQAASASRTTYLLVTAALLAVTIIFALLLGRSITAPLQRTLAALREISEGSGDLRSRLEVSGRDELAALAQAFNTFIAKLQDTVSQIAEATNRLAANAEQLSGVAGDTSGRVATQKDETDQAASAMNQMVATVQEVARNAGEAATAVEATAGQAGDGRRVVVETIDAMRSLAENMESSGSAITALSEEAERIGEVLDVIRAVAEQTNLLALNAAIEAARAGEHGRGFTVVADEVRTLASRTQESTNTIQEMIDGLRERVGAVVDQVQRSRELGDVTMERASEAGKALDGITQAVDTMSRMNTQIASAAEEQTAVAEQINRNVTQIRELTDQTAAGAHQTAGSSEELTRLGEELEGLVRRFRV